jgi:hypothetical protein
MRFFNNLEKRIEALRGHHVGLVQDENLEAISGGANTARSRKSLASSTPLWLAASISTASKEPEPPLAS